MNICFHTSFCFSYQLVFKKILKDLFLYNLLLKFDSSWSLHPSFLEYYLNKLKNLIYLNMFQHKFQLFRPDNRFLRRFIWFFMWKFNHPQLGSTLTKLNVNYLRILPHIFQLFNWFLKSKLLKLFFSIYSNIEIRPILYPTLTSGIMIFNLHYLVMLQHKI